ncbi:MAG: U32 family peptidase [Bacteroidales bacterium]|nr:U32 family peptidase [Bacteroidales bacterium]
MQPIELLAPARDAEIGIEAFRHGADAVYIGAPRFSARAAAGNEVKDIARLADFGHQFGCRTMVAFNTILRDDELKAAEQLTWQLYDAGVDALIVQDMGLLRLDLPPIALHASTQMDNRTAEKVRLLHQLGFTRAVLARELSVAEIRAIHEAVPDIELEVFVHGALCVCISGQCYLSAALTGRSANRGECAQPCRLPMDLVDASGKTLVRQKHLLSLRDMNRSAYLQELIDAGVTSLKVEGRLKDMSYVKNIVAYYRQQLDKLGVHGADRITYTFEPCPEKSFNRGFTSYFAGGKREEMWNFDSPKSMGEPIGEIVEVGQNWLRVKGKAVHNGDGLVCDRTIGFRANRVDERGRIYPLNSNALCPQLRKGMKVNRNLDLLFEQQLQKPSAERRVPLTLCYTATPTQLELILSRPGCTVVVRQEGTFEAAQRSQEENVRKQLSKLGDTIYEAQEVEVQGADLFVPSSVLNLLRREGVQLLNTTWMEQYDRERRSFHKPDYVTLSTQVDASSALHTDFKANVMNSQARALYAQMGIADVEKAFEVNPAREGVVMQTRHCLKMALGKCPKYSQKEGAAERISTPSWQEPLALKIGNEKFLLKFGCKNACISEIIRIFAPE